MNTATSETSSGNASAVHDYLDWNRAIAHELFRPGQLGTQIYLDLNPERVQRLATAMSVDSGAVRKLLVESLDRRLHKQRANRRLIFGWFDDMLDEWRLTRRSSGVPPPVVGILTVFSMAAEDMGTDSGVSAPERTYYPQLTDLLGLPIEQRTRVGDSFRNSVERYQEALEEWLDMQGGEFGELSSLPTINFRYVGIPVSQVLLRQAERANLRLMFTAEMLQPGSAVDEQTLELMIDGWVRDGRGSRRLIDVWTKKKLREAVVAIAANELQAWTGDSGVANSASRTRGLRVMSWQSQRGIRKTVKFGLYRDSASNADSTWTVQIGASTTTATTVELSPGNFGIRLDTIVDDVAAVLEQKVVVTDETGESFERHPDPVVILEFDRRTERFLEAETTNFDSSYQFLVRTDIEILREKTQEFFAGLTDSVESSTPTGLPRGWTIFSPVRFRAAAGFVNHSAVFSSLLRAVPRAPRRLTFAEGVKIPGRSNFYSSLVPPKILVGDPVDGLKFSVELPSIDSRDDGVKVFGDATEPFDLTRSLPHPPENGDYKVQLLLDSVDGRRILENRTLRLRSSDSADIEDLSGTLVRSTYPLSALRVVTYETDLEVGFVGARSYIRPTDLPAFPPVDPTWSFPHFPVRDDREVGPRDASALECIHTGIHRIYVETVNGGRFQRQTFKCCGKVKTTPTFSSRRESFAGGRTIADLARARGPHDESDRRLVAAAVLDALRAANSGSIRSLETLLSHVEVGDSTPYRRILDLQALSTIEVSYDDRWKASSWSSIPPGLASTPTGSVLMTGGWTRRLRGEVLEIVADEGGTVDDATQFGRNVPVIHSCSLDTLREYDDTMRVVFQADDAASGMMRALPHIGDVIADLPRHELHDQWDWALFSVRDCTWTSADVRPDAPGFYRRSVHGSFDYVLRTPQDVAAGTGRRTTVEFGKHAAAALAGTQLYYYDRASERVAVPLGARLPGLYERALVMCSGSLPESDVYDRTTLFYRAVPDDIAFQLAGRMSLAN